MMRFCNLLLALFLAVAALTACNGSSSTAASGLLSFSGAVVDIYGAPVNNASIILRVYNTDNGYVTWSGQAMRTDTQGRFSFSFDPNNLGSQAESYTVGVKSSPADFLRAAWYQAANGSTPDEDQATRISAASPQSLNNITLIMQPGGTIQVSVDASGYVDFLGTSHAWSEYFTNAGTSTVVLAADNYRVRFHPMQGDRVWWAGAGQSFDPAQAQAIPIQPGQQAASSPAFQAAYLLDTQTPGLVLQRINHYRSLVGVSPLRLLKPDILSQAARNHADYLIQNNLGYNLGLNLHNEDQQQYPLGFTGTTPTDRVVYANGGPLNGWGPAEDIAPGKGPMEATDALVHTVYHQVPLLHADSLYLGAGRAHNADGSLEYTVVEVGMSSTSSRHALYTYPADGQTDLPTDFIGEIPDPLTGSGLSFPVGIPISIYAPGHTLLVNTATLSDTQGNNINLLILDKNTDPNQYLRSDNVFLIPYQTLSPFTTYTVTALYSLDGVASQNLSFSFTTGAGLWP